MFQSELGTIKDQLSISEKNYEKREKKQNEEIERLKKDHLEEMSKLKEQFKKNVKSNDAIKEQMEKKEQSNDVKLSRMENMMAQILKMHCPEAPTDQSIAKVNENGITRTREEKSKSETDQPSPTRSPEKKRLKEINDGTLQPLTEVVMENEEGEDKIEFTQVTGSTPKSTPKRRNSTPQEKQDETMEFKTVTTPSRRNSRKQKQPTKSPSVTSPPKVSRRQNRYSNLRGDDQNV